MNGFPSELPTFFDAFPLDPLTCPRCQLPAHRLITYPGGAQLCPTCAYPAGGAPQSDNLQED